MGRVIVIGAGAAGMMAAGAAATNGVDVLLLEKNIKPGRKLNITGKGRCNLTNNTDVDGLTAHVLSNPRFLMSAFHTMDSYGLMNFFESLGVPLKTERGGRVFPVSDNASDITNALFSFIRENGADVKLGCDVRGIKRCDEGFIVQTSAGDFGSAAVVVATGGLSYPATGSTGDGYAFAKAFGHSVTKTCPSLVPLTTKEAWVSELEGLSLNNVRVSAKLSPERSIYEETGEMMFTKNGVTGPVILRAGAVLGHELQKNNCVLSIDLKPGLSEQQLDKRLLRDFAERKNKNFANALDDLLPKRLIGTIVSLSEIPGDKKVNLLSREERKELVRLFKSLTLNLTGTAGFKEAVITKGGVCVRGVFPGTMMSRHMEGLFFAGEVLDVDAMTGGYNLQIAFSTGRLAGIGCAEYIKNKRKGPDNE